MIWLDKNDLFPSVKEADKDGLLAAGGDLSSERLINAYKSGIFPWFNEGEPILWWSPDPRMVLFPKELKISKSTKKLIKEKKYHFTENKDFNYVVEQCAHIKRKGQSGTWINTQVKEAYLKLHEMGIAKSVEVWDHDKIIGGFYGVTIGKVFCGESMFSKESNASKLGFIYFVEKYTHDLSMIDCQVYTPYLASLGAKEIPRDSFLSILQDNLT